VKGTLDMGLQIVNTPFMLVSGFSDVDWAGSLVAFSQLLLTFLFNTDRQMETVGG
jgi:hypothetical protein